MDVDAIWQILFCLMEHDAEECEEQCWVQNASLLDTTGDGEVVRQRPIVLHLSLLLETFRATIGGRFAPLTIMGNEDTDMDSMIITFNTAVTETASEILCIHRQRQKTLGHCRNS